MVMNIFTGFDTSGFSKNTPHKYLHFGPVLCGTTVDINLCEELSKN